MKSLCSSITFHSPNRSDWEAASPVSSWSNAPHASRAHSLGDSISHLRGKPAGNQAAKGVRELADVWEGESGGRDHCRPLATPRPSLATPRPSLATPPLPQELSGLPGQVHGVRRQVHRPCHELEDQGSKAAQGGAGESNLQEHRVLRPGRRISLAG